MADSVAPDQRRFRLLRQTAPLREVSIKRRWNRLRTLGLQKLRSLPGQQVEQVEDGGGYRRRLSGCPCTVWPRQLLRLEPVLQVLDQLLACARRARETGRDVPVCCA